MKVKLTIELELPSNFPTVLDSLEDSLSEILFDHYINFATIQHSVEATRWCARGKVGSDDEEPTSKQIYLVHKTWTEICSAAKWSFEVSEHTIEDVQYPIQVVASPAN